MSENYKKIESLFASIQKFQKENIIKHECLFLTSKKNHNTNFDGYAFFPENSDCFKKVLFKDPSSENYEEKIENGNLVITGFDYKKIILSILYFLNGKRYKIA